MARSLKELYGIILDSLKAGDKPGFYNFGICGEMKDLYSKEVITKTEWNKLKKHFNQQDPNFNKKFAHFKNGNLWSGTNWWWVTMRGYREINVGAREVRIEFIEAVIKTLK